jgi:hypothetical protein
MTAGTASLTQSPPRQSTAAAGTENSADALSAAFESAAAALRTSAAGDQRVMAAFALGWQMAEVYGRHRRAGAAAAAQEDLPGIPRLKGAELQEIGLLQLRAGITKLRPSICAAGLEVPDAQRFADAVKKIDDPCARRQAIREFHVGLLATLTAADFRLGKAYCLGRAVSDTTQPPSDWRAELDTSRVATMASSIRELASALPPHAAHPVARSLEAWSRWAQAESGDGGETGRKLPAQGRLWRSLLSGEKEPTAVLEASDYMRAGEGMLQRAGELAGKFMRHYWWLPSIAFVLLGLGIWLIVGPGSGLAAGLGGATIFASVGLSWKGVATSLGKAGARVEEPLWQAELDQAIYERITPDEIVQSQRGHKTGPDEPSLDAGTDERPGDSAPVAQAPSTTTQDQIESDHGSEA